MPEQEIASAPDMRGALVPEGYVEQHRGYVEQTEHYRSRAREAEAEVVELVHELLCARNDLELSQTHNRVQEAEYAARMRAMVEEKINRHRDARQLRAEIARLRGEIDRLAAHANLRRLTIKALARERDEREVEAELLRAHLKLVCEDAARVAPFVSVERALALLAVERPCAPCAAGMPGSCNDLFEGAA